MNSSNRLCSPNTTSAMQQQSNSSSSSSAEINDTASVMLSTPKTHLSSPGRSHHRHHHQQLHNHHRHHQQHLLQDETITTNAYADNSYNSCSSSSPPPPPTAPPASPAPRSPPPPPLTPSSLRTIRIANAIANNTTPSTSNRNKRKNFHPRYSSHTADEMPYKELVIDFEKVQEERDQQQHHHHHRHNQLAQQRATTTTAHRSSFPLSTSTSSTSMLAMTTSPTSPPNGNATNATTTLPYPTPSPWLHLYEAMAKVNAANVVAATTADGVGSPSAVAVPPALAAVQDIFKMYGVTMSKNEIMMCHEAAKAAAAATAASFAGGPSTSHQDISPSSAAVATQESSAAMLLHQSYQQKPNGWPKSSKTITNYAEDSDGSTAPTTSTATHNMDNRTTFHHERNISAEQASSNCSENDKGPSQNFIYCSRDPDETQCRRPSSSSNCGSSPPPSQHYRVGVDQQATGGGPDMQTANYAHDDDVFDDVLVTMGEEVANGEQDNDDDDDDDGGSSNQHFDDDLTQRPSSKNSYGYMHASDVHDVFNDDEEDDHNNADYDGDDLLLSGSASTSGCPSRQLMTAEKSDQHSAALMTNESGPRISVRNVESIIYNCTMDMLQQQQQQQQQQQHHHQHQQQRQPHSPTAETATSSDVITTAPLTTTPTQALELDEKHLILHSADFVKNLTKYTSHLECKNATCQLENLRDHYHCYDLPCYGKTLSKKEEIIRHVKWHKKRNESLNHGFLRFSSTDDCSQTFGEPCQHNRKQTHYHCFQPNCDRVYISTSDVQMHSNYHRKDSAIHKEGFQRYRASEECHADYCMFAGQKTTHFHCRRDNCRFTFKNKADMEKHKTFHIKDMQLARDGFKKFLKNEPCPFKQCRFSRVCNHIHCARENCFYVLHSSGQLLSHKRKHERIDNEQAYCRYKMMAVKAAAMLSGAGSTPSSSSDVAAAAPLTDTATTSTATNNLAFMQLKELEMSAFAAAVAAANATDSPSSSSSIVAAMAMTSTLSPTSPEMSTVPPPSAEGSESLSSPPQQLSPTIPLEFLQQMQKRHQELLLRQHHRATSPEQPGHPPAKMMTPLHAAPGPLMLQYYYPTSSGSAMPGSPHQSFPQNEPMNLKSSLTAGAEADDDVDTAAPSECFFEERREPLLHCNMQDFEASVPRAVADITSHMRVHEFQRASEHTPAADRTFNVPYCAGPGVITTTTTANTYADHLSSNPMQITTIDGFFNRKRGRPPKNRFVEVYKNAQHSPQAIFTSFKLEKQSIVKDRSSPGEAAAGSSNQLPTTTTTTTSSGGTQSNHHTELTSPLSRSSPAIQQDAELPVPVLPPATPPPPPPPPPTTIHTASSSASKFSQVRSMVSDEDEPMVMHLEQPYYSMPTFANWFNMKFRRFDRQSGLDCGVTNCRLRKSRPHLHCRQCLCQISPFNLESHVCQFATGSGSCGAGIVAWSPPPRVPSPKLSNVLHKSYAASAAAEVPTSSTCGITADADFSRTLHQAEGVVAAERVGVTSHGHMRHYIQAPLSSQSSFYYQHQHSHREGSHIGRRFHNASEPFVAGDTTTDSVAAPSDEEKVSVVRAAGTYFPAENSSNSHVISAAAAAAAAAAATNSRTPSVSLATTTTTATPSTTGNTSAAALCDVPFCRVKRKVHKHCPLCNLTFTDPIKAGLHRLKHSNYSNSTAEVEAQEYHDRPRTNEESVEEEEQHTDQPQDLSVSVGELDSVHKETIRRAAEEPCGHPAIHSGGNLPSTAAATANFHLNNMSMQNLHLAQLATSLYQQNPAAMPYLYYQSFYPRFVGASGQQPPQHQQHHHLQLQLRNATDVTRHTPASVSPTALLPPPPPLIKGNNRKRKSSSSVEDFNALIESLQSLPPAAKKQMQLVAGLAGLTGTAPGYVANQHTISAPAEQHQPPPPPTMPVMSVHGNFKLKDEQIPTGYLKFRFNEDCYFPKCGYRNHQSHFHCDRTDCHYSFCDKTRFVQHTARHERLDKLMGDDFRQYRANMCCGYPDCAYYKNLGPVNKSSHFHCLKCNFICSDTNKVVAHRRQHSKMEYIRMAGFRKVANNEKCSDGASIESVGDAAGCSHHATTAADACPYSLKQTHYHCLICDCSVLSRAQLGSHKHKGPPSASSTATAAAERGETVSTGMP